MPQSVDFKHGGGITSAAGAEAGKDVAYSAISEADALEAYRKANNMAGIGKAPARAKPEWKQKEGTYIASWRKEQEAKRLAQQRAAKDLADKPIKTAATE